MKKSRILLAALAGCAISSSAQAIVVQTELSLLMDVSGSVTAAEFSLQQQGYVQAFQNGAIQALVAQATGGVAVNLIMWSGNAEQSQVVSWTHLTNAAQCNAFAAAINAVVRPFGGQTAPGSAINFAYLGANNIFNNNFEGGRQIIDVSGDGAQNEGFATATARNNALAAGVEQINGLVILGEAGVQTWYQNNVVGGTGAFLEVANDHQDFAAAVQRKILTELAPVPLPGVGGLVCAGMGLLAIRRRRNA